MSEPKIQFPDKPGPEYYWKIDMPEVHPLFQVHEHEPSRKLEVILAKKITKMTKPKFLKRSKPYDTTLIKWSNYVILEKPYFEYELGDLVAEISEKIQKDYDEHNKARYLKSRITGIFE